MGDHSDYLCVPPAGACGIERPHGEWLVLMCCDSTDVRLELLPAESSVYMRNGWFGYAVMLWVITMIDYDYLCVPPAGACGIERPHGERLVLACCAAPDVCPERVLLESSVYMGNG